MASCCPSCALGTETTSQAKHHLNIVVLDACRNNPWPETLHNGLAPITAIPRGTVVLYATAANDSTRKADIDMPAGVAGIVRMREAHRKGPEEKHDRSG